MKRLLTLIAVLALSVPASADEVMLRDGRKIVGMAREDGDKIVVEMGLGSISVSRDEVLSIARGETPIHAYAAKWDAVKNSSKASDFAELVAFCKEEKLTRYLPTLLTKILELDPENDEARKDLGYIKVEGKWYVPEEANRARGMVLFEGKWMFPLEIELIKARRLESAEKKLDQDEKRDDKDKKKDAKRRIPIEEPSARPLGIPGASDEIRVRSLGFGAGEYSRPRRHHYGPRSMDSCWDFYFMQRVVWGMAPFSPICPGSILVIPQAKKPATMMPVPP